MQDAGGVFHVTSCSATGEALPQPNPTLMIRLLPHLTTARPTGRTGPIALGGLGLALLCGSCGDSPVPAPGTCLLPDEAKIRGLSYENRSGRPEKATILEANGAGVALLDLDGDLDLDLVFAQGLGSLAELRSGPGADLEVFENDGHGFFTRREGPGLEGWWTGLAVGDIDGDGLDDLVAAGFGRLVLLLQDSSGALVVQQDSGIEPTGTDAYHCGAEREADSPAPSWPTSMALFDANLDGALDLYVGRYLDFDPGAPEIDTLGAGELALPCRFKGYTVFCGPRGLVPQADLFFLGDGQGKFADATDKFLGENTPAYTLGVAAFDIEGDGDTDLFVAVDSAPNKLFANQNGEYFLDRAREAGVALSQDGRPEAGMGAAFGDVNRDGLHDLVVTNFSSEPTQLYFGSSAGFKQQTFRSGLSRETKRLLSWGVHLFDLDADGNLELFTANGHVYPQADQEYTGTSYGQADALWSLRESQGGFEAVRLRELHEDSLLAAQLSSRGSALGDIDGNGTPDLVVTRTDQPAGLGMNYEGGANHRLWIRLIGTPNSPGPNGRRTPRDGHGARVAVVLENGATALLGEVQTSVGYQSASSAPLHFGLGQSKQYASLRVFWPSGRTQEFQGGRADRVLTITEGSDQIQSEDFR